MHTHDRLHALDAVRGFALLLGIFFHAGFSFIPGMIPGVWAIVDVSPSVTIAVALFASHIFRMSLFFFLAGFFGRMMLQRRGLKAFWRDRLKRILVPLVVGWVVLFPSIAAVWVWGLTKTFGGQLPAAPAGLPAPPPGAFPLTHLWFLYYLLVLYVMVTVLRAAFLAIDRQGNLRRGIDAVVRRTVSSGAAVALLGLPLALAFCFRSDWIQWFGIPTPDQSLIPQVTSLIAYGTAFSFGFLVHRQPELLQAWQRQWGWHLAAAVVATAGCLAIAGTTPAFTPALPGPRTWTFAVLYSFAIWAWVFAITGVALRYLSTASPVRRYVADSAYWLYLTHLPIVAALQVLVGHLPWPWAVKFPLILAASLAILFLSYHTLVRFTFVGALLNGRRHVRGERHAPIAAPSPANAESSQSLAVLDSVHKRFGKTLALEGVDLALSPGETLAVLGPNGAGKSTAISLMLGLLEADRGAAKLLGQSPADVEPRRSVGVMMQDVALQPILRVREHIALTASYYPHPMSVDEAMTLTGTTGLADRMYRSLSAGQKRQVQFALAICGRPRILFLDEPSVGLDVQARERMWETIRALVAAGTAVVLTTHYLEEAEALADRIVVLANGRVIASGSVDEVRSIVSLKHITCSSRLDVEALRAWPDVIEVSHDTRRLKITAADAESVVRRLLESDANLRDLEVRPAGLAEAFAELTKAAA